MKLIFYIFTAFLLLVAGTAPAQEIVNGGFELLNSKGIPRGWATLGKTFNNQISVDSGISHAGKYAVKLEAAAGGKPAEAIIYNSYGLSSAKALSTIEVSGWFKITHAADSALSLFIQSLSGRQIIYAYGNAHANAINQWQKITVQFKTDARKPWAGFYYGISLKHNALAWADDVTVKVDGQIITDAASLYREPAAGSVAWLNRNLQPLASVSLQADDTDMAAIGRACGSARLVGMGEPTHGTREALQFKLRLLNYLVAQKGFNTIALEEVIPVCDEMNDLINTNAAALKDSLLSMPFYKLYKTAEMYELFAWISRYNQSHRRKVKLIGLDMEDVRIRRSRALLHRFGLLHNPPIARQVEDLNIQIDSLIASNIPGANAARVQKLADTFKATVNRLDTLVGQLQNPVDAGQLYRMQTYVRVCRQWLDTRFYNAAPDARDRYLADNVRYYTNRHPQDKVLLWAHNQHIANLTTNGRNTMGACLKAMYGKGYYAIAFTTAAGNYTAAQDNSQKKWQVYPVEAAYRGTYPYLLGKAKSSLYFLPFNTPAAAQKDARWLLTPMKHLNIAYLQAGRQDDYEYYGTLKTTFDGVVFCRQTTGTLTYLK